MTLFIHSSFFFRLNDLLIDEFSLVAHLEPLLSAEPLFFNEQFFSVREKKKDLLFFYIIFLFTSFLRFYNIFITGKKNPHDVECTYSFRLLFPQLPYPKFFMPFLKKVTSDQELFSKSELRMASRLKSSDFILDVICFCFTILTKIKVHFSHHTGNKGG